MARRSLKPQLNQIRAWVQQGRTNAWIAHQLEVSTAELQEFRNQHELTGEGEDTGSQEVDLRDEIEAEVEAATAEEVSEDDEAEKDDDQAEDDEAEDEDDKAEEKDADAEGPGGESGSGAPRRRRRRGRRGGRGRRKELEGTFDHGEQDGYGLWLDPSIKDNPVYTEHWAGKREVTVRIDPDQIVIRLAGAVEADDSED
jgi:hypothetical protein